MLILYALLQNYLLIFYIKDGILIKASAVFSADNLLRTVCRLNLFAAEAETLQNVYTPFPLAVHIVLALAAVVVFFIQYYRKGGFHYVLMIVATAETLITQLPGFSSNKPLILALEISEVVLCSLVIITLVLGYVRKKSKARKLNAEQREQENEQKKVDYEEYLKRADTEQQKDKNPVDNAFKE